MRKNIKQIIHFSPKRKIHDIDVEKSICCKCGKLWGMNYHKRVCKKCKTEVIARGKK